MQNLTNDIIEMYLEYVPIKSLCELLISKQFLKLQQKAIRNRLKMHIQNSYIYYKLVSSTELGQNYIKGYERALVLSQNVFTKDYGVLLSTELWYQNFGTILNLYTSDEKSLREFVTIFKESYLYEQIALCGGLPLDITHMPPQVLYSNLCGIFTDMEKKIGKNLCSTLTWVVMDSYSPNILMNVIDEISSNNLYKLTETIC